jgi:hypothetical protein
LDWFTAAGHIYHRSCSSDARWTTDLAGKTCSGCGAAIPEDILERARSEPQPALSGGTRSSVTDGDLDPSA